MSCLSYVSATLVPNIAFSTTSIEVILISSKLAVERTMAFESLSDMVYAVQLLLISMGPGGA